MHIQGKPSHVDVPALFFMSFVQADSQPISAVLSVTAGQINVNASSCVFSHSCLEPIISAARFLLLLSSLALLGLDFTYLFLSTL